MITREDVRDLRAGDVVELRFASGSTIRGPLESFGPRAPGLWIVDTGLTVRAPHGGPGLFPDAATLTVISRAPRPLYVNHSRTTPVPGDVVRDADDDGNRQTWQHDGNPDSWWQPGPYGSPQRKRLLREALPHRLRLLVDGETGQVVP